MPLVSHPNVTEPAASVLLWRYTDLAKFTALLLGQKLWLSSAEQLAVQDPYEATLPEPSAKAFSDFARADLQNAGHADMPDFQEQLAKLYETVRPYLFVNCWHMSAVESVAMWKIYASEHAGIAIVSSSERMARAFRKSKLEVHLGQVSYVDHEAQFMGPNLFDVALKKRLSYAYESEAILIHMFGSGGKIGPLPTPPPGVEVACNLNHLIERVVISPAADVWFLEMVKALCRKMGVRRPVVQSRLLVPPARTRGVVLRGPASHNPSDASSNLPS
ncbi:DUF2971 domain-containing protein [Caulobacter sp.]|uniref:DUF2971 domain-containing protein n=1 Tax=Caulobacter sp. TaxID=78 RepID=UPI001B293F6B|nr:DUF2971 domain-containing protein [Caulobacter sp.]MBO9543696.1 DUF2971 domain-containing protein [Caulobacter sp.]